jgi:tetratricopeptide (TPR) repeat protein
VSHSRHTLRLLAATLALLGVAVAVEVQRDRVYANVRAADEGLLYIRSGAAMEKLALSYDAVIADLYWIRALQHYGHGRLHPEAVGHYELLYPLLDLTTSLDPKFTVAYRFGAIFLAEPAPGGAGRPDQAVALLEKGVEAMPLKWEFCHDIGFVYYWHLHNYQKAAEWFARGAALPNAPWWLRTYAAVMLTRGGDRQASRAMWQNILQTAEDKFLKESAERRLVQLDALDQIEQLKRVVEQSERLRGKRPAAWQELVAAGRLRGLPTDPAGAPYELNPATGDVTMSHSSPLYPLPTEPYAGQPGQQ